ncbi:MAG: FAD-binding oxidoreductase [Deltaproteobacteria bacterium]|nr:FAD-binding oxidoreductase [Deltaproteobacteria bacterium]
MSLDAERLRLALGADAVSDAAGEIDGVKHALTLAPASGEALADTLRLLSEAGAAAIVSGAGTRLGVGNPPRRADALLSTRRLDGIAELDADEGVARVAAGTPLEVLRKAAQEAGWELPLESPDDAATVGGTLASSAVGPRLQCFGPPRDHVLGLRVALASGERARCGGRVVKNVTGYDLIKLHAGAFGTLGVLEEAWLRLRPRPEERRVLLAWLPEGQAGLERAAAAAGQPAARAAVVVDPALARQVDDAGPRYGRALLVVELGGAPELVRDGGASLADLEPVEADAELLDRIAALQRQPDGHSGLRFRVVVRPARIGAAAERLARAGASLLVWPGAGFLYAGFPLYEGADELAVDGAWRAARGAAREGAGGFVLEAAPPWAKAARDVFGDPPEALPLMRTLKQRFDPAGVLNPGRFVGRI